MKKTIKKKLLWKSMQAGMKSRHGDIDWKLNKWQKISGDLKLCSSGFHASENVIDAMGFVNCEVLAQVEVRGKHLKESDKQVWQEMRIVKAYEWTKEDSVSLAVYAAELVIDIYEKEYPNDKRPREAIEAAKAYLKDPSEENRAAAYAAYAAANAAYAAAYAAYAAAYAAANAAYAAACAAYAAANAANAAAYAAYAAANAAAYAAALKDVREKCAKFVVKRLKMK